MFTDLPKRILINEVVTRDGFQSEPDFVPTADKVELINALAGLGLNKIEVTSFVSPHAVPNLSDAADVIRAIRKDTQTRYVALVPNQKGCARALELGVDEINLVMSVSESHNLANMRMTCDQSLQQFEQIAGMTSGTSMRLNGSLATSFGCPFEGQHTQERIVRFVDAYLERGLHSLTLADTTGMAAPNQVQTLCEAVRKRWPELELTLHFHNTRGLGLANVLAALAAGVNQFDASLGGLGGCPFAPGATGNICTEDLVHMLNEMSLNTGVDLDGLLLQSLHLAEILKEGSRSRELYGNEVITERHRHRYEFNNQYLQELEQAGLTIAGKSMDDKLVEVVEIADHPWFVACQFHPEFTSNPRDGHPLFTGFIRAAREHQSATASKEDVA